MIPFFAFALGAGLDLSKVWQAGLLGLAMGVAVVVVTGIPLFLAGPLDRGTGVAGSRPPPRRANAAACRPSSPRANPAYADAAGPATILVAACVVVTAILVPVATAWTSRRFGDGGAADPADETVESAAPAQPHAGR